MKKGILLILRSVFLLLYFSCCHSNSSVNNNSIAADTALIAKGESSFVQHCSGCHNFKMDEIGPQLGGLTAKVPADWIAKFIKDPKKMIESGDERAQKLFKKYNVLMPSFAAYHDSEINAIVAFLNIYKQPQQYVNNANRTCISQPF